MAAVEFSWNTTTLIEIDMLWAIRQEWNLLRVRGREGIEIERANISFSCVCVKAHLICLSHQFKGVYFTHIQNDRNVCEWMWMCRRLTTTMKKTAISDFVSITWNISFCWKREEKSDTFKQSKAYEYIVIVWAWVWETSTYQRNPICTRAKRFSLSKL